ncbi:MAG TPA: inositol 2-dehydrogenase [Telluria sp.]|nr:inositol 2-dehydrogenase [Telluria sp.]
MIKLAVFGTGRIGYVHALNAAAHPSVKLDYLVDPLPSAHLNDLAAKTGARIVDADTVFADTAIDGVVIASSTDTHAELMLKSAATGKAMFCEKPISLNFSLVSEVAAAVEKAGTPCMLGFQRRYDPNFRMIRERIASGTAGKLEQVVMHTRDPAPPPVEYVKRSGGMFRDQAIHDFDMARYLLGEEIKTVYAVGGCLIDPAIGAAGDIDTAMITLVSASGRFVQMNNCRRAPFGYDQRLEALCEKEVLYVENRLRDSVTIASAAGFTVSPPMNYFIERFADAYRLEMGAFVAMLEQGQAPLAGIRDGLEAQRLAEAAMVSMKSGQPVQLDAGWQPG